MNKPLVTLKIIRSHYNYKQMVRMVASRKTKRIFHFIQAAKFKDCVFAVKVNYGKGFKNEGEYKTKKDLLFALRAFLEKD